MAKSNGICKVKKKDGTYLVRVGDSDMEFDPMTEAEYRASLITPDFDHLEEGTWLPPGFSDGLE